MTANHQVDRLDDRLIDRAFDLAFFLVPDKEAAMDIVGAALGKLQVAATRQDKRLYYRLRRPSRTKVSWGDTQLLQRLVYIEAEPFERERERRGQASPDELLIHFIKHLVRITLRRNSFYSTLGVSRLLHRYTTGETMEIYNAVIQDPERLRDDSYYRSRKSRLIEELEARFAGMVRVTRGARGEAAFESAAVSERTRNVAQESLSRFTPWETSCPIPKVIDAKQEVLMPLRFGGDHADDEHAVEVRRIHAVLHPACYDRLTRSVGLDAPASRLQLPMFFAASDDGDRPQRPAALHDSDRARLGAKRRPAQLEGLLRVLVDGIERARMEGTTLELDLSDDAELIEVFSGSSLVAVYLAGGEGTSVFDRWTFERSGTGITIRYRRPLADFFAIPMLRPILVAAGAAFAVVAALFQMREPVPEARRVTPVAVVAPAPAIRPAPARHSRATPPKNDDDDVTRDAAPIARAVVTPRSVYIAADDDLRSQFAEALPNKSGLTIAEHDDADCELRVRRRGGSSIEVMVVGADGAILRARRVYEGTGSVARAAADLAKAYPIRQSGSPSIVKPAQK